MPTAKPKAKGGAVGAITRKIGPLPLWAWFVGALAAYYLYTKVRGGGAAPSTSSVSAGSGTPGPNVTDSSGAPGPGSGGTGADSMSSDLLSALLQGQSQSEQALVDALNASYANSQYAAGGYGGYGGAAPGSISANGPATQTVAAPASTQPATPTQTKYTYTEPVGSASLSPAPDIQWLGTEFATPLGTAQGSYYGTLTPYNPTQNPNAPAALTAASAQKLVAQ